MKLSQPIQWIYCVTADTQYELASSFMRLQEFYESPYPDIKGQYFTREEYEDCYASAMGNFTYYTDWSGFNVPMDCVKRFFTIFRDLNRKELRLLETLLPALEDNCTWAKYVIGAVKNDQTTLNHELAHGLYCNGLYRLAMDRLTAKFKPANAIRKWLKNKGYDASKFNDEIQAYMATSPPAYLKNFKLTKKDVLQYQEVFERHSKQWR